MDDANLRKIFLKAVHDITPSACKQSSNQKSPPVDLECLTSLHKPVVEASSIHYELDDIPIPPPKPCVAVNSVTSVYEDALQPAYSLLETVYSARKSCFVTPGHSSLVSSTSEFPSNPYLDELQELNQLSLAMPKDQAKMEDVNSCAFKSISENYQSSADSTSSSEDEGVYDPFLPAIEEPEPVCSVKDVELTPSVYHLMSRISATGRARREAALERYKTSVSSSSVNLNSNDNGNSISESKTEITLENSDFSESPNSHTYLVKGKCRSLTNNVLATNDSAVTESQTISSGEIIDQSESCYNATKSFKARNLLQKENFSIINNCVEGKVINENSSISPYKSLAAVVSPMSNKSYTVNGKSSFTNSELTTKEIGVSDWSSPVGRNSTYRYYRNETVDRNSSIVDIHEESKICAPGSLRKKPKIDVLRSSIDNRETVDNRFQSSFSENYVSNEQRSSYGTPKRPFQAMYDNYSHIQSKADQTPYSPLVRTPNFSNFKNRMNTFLPRYDAAELLTLSPRVGFVDTHCHLDFLFKRACHTGSYEAYREILKEYFPISYEACVAIFCDPHTFPMESLWKPIIEEDGVWAAFGCHPHNAMDYDEIYDESLINAVKHKKVRALGEIGLDYSNRNNCRKEVQHKVFRRQLKLAIDRNMPLVIHCRDATDDCLEIMTEMIPKNHKIHLHCFTGDWDTAQRWMDEFPNLFIGITNVVTYPTATCVHEVVKKMPLERLLLETDAPYFLPRTVPRSLRWSHPGMAIHVAAQITALRRNVNLEEVLVTVRKNTNRMYSI